MVAKKLLFLFIFFSCFTHAQEIKVPIDTTITTKHLATINGAKINYTATTGMQPVWNNENKAIF